MKTTIFIVCVGIFCIAIAGAHIAGKQAAESPRTITVRKEAIVWDIQAYLMGLNNPRYDIGPKGVDGKWGTDTNTAVENYCNDEAAKQWFPEEEQEK